MMMLWIGREAAGTNHKYTGLSTADYFGEPFRHTLGPLTRIRCAAISLCPEPTKVPFAASMCQNDLQSDRSHHYAYTT